MTHTQTAIRFLIVLGCLGAAMYAIEMSRPEPQTAFWCDVQTTSCYDRLGAR